MEQYGWLPDEAILRHFYRGPWVTECSFDDPTSHGVVIKRARRLKIQPGGKVIIRVGPEPAP